MHKVFSSVAVSIIIIAFVCVSIGKPPVQSAPPYSVNGPLTEPRIFGEGVISTNDYERGGTFTPDGREFYFTKRAVPGYFWTICFSRFENGKWSTPEVASFSGQYLDADPFISSDGSKLFFASARPIDDKPKRDFDIWVVNRTSKGWSEPRNLGAPVNTAASESYPTLTKNGTLYFCSGRPDGKGLLDIYRSRLVDGKYTEPENLGDTINTPSSEAYPFIAPDESYLIFTSYYREDEIYGNGHRYVRGDLYISLMQDGKWTEPRHLDPPINTGAFEGCPTISPDGKYFFFTSERSSVTNLPKQQL